MSTESWNPVFHEWVWRTVFNDTISSSEMLFSFCNLLYIWSIEQEALEDSFLMKCGGEGCFEEVFDGRAWREELGFISHAIPHPLKTTKMVKQSHIFLKAYSTNFKPFKSPADARLGCVLSRVNVTFSQPPSSKLASPARCLWLNKACGSPLTWHSWVSSSISVVKVVKRYFLRKCNC